MADYLGTNLAQLFATIPSSQLANKVVDCLGSPGTRLVHVERVSVALVSGKLTSLRDPDAVPISIPHTPRSLTDWGNDCGVCCWYHR
jgi:hypothetical protein